MKKFNQQRVHGLLTIKYPRKPPNSVLIYGLLVIPHVPDAQPTK
jgi:hypothetical protein